ncbi:MAG: indole-3-glycerol phosphate synthase TrpC [Cellulosilyticum sp.]|nr:indole-3-glycerol phosphate synthase TrpC [Cellulosilyticum sp.]
MILNEILANRKKAIADLKETITISTLEKQISALNIRHLSFKEALKKQDKPLNVIAEVKKASPSKGLICKAFNHLEIAKSYEKGQAAALSVLTEPTYFQGCNQYLTEIKGEVCLPVLRKDFIIDPFQIYEAKAIGADAILLIVAALSPRELKVYLDLANQLELDVLVETHNEQEVKIALEAGAEIIGVNNRNLQTFEVSLEISERLRKLIPKEKVFVAESGIHTVEDIKRLKALEINAVLIGESVVKAQNPKDKLQELINA